MKSLKHNCYGRCKGSRTLPFRLIVSTHFTFQDAVERYNELLDQRKKLLDSTGRLIRAQALTVGDPIPAKLADLRNDIAQIDVYLWRLREDFPGVEL